MVHGNGTIRFFNVGLSSISPWRRREAHGHEQGRLEIVVVIESTLRTDMYAGHLDLNAPLFWTVDDVLSKEERLGFIEKIEREVGEVAPIIGLEGPEVDQAVRNNTRVMWDDEKLAAELLQRVRAKVPDRLMSMSLGLANERIRLYRYSAGQRHGAHWDTPIERVTDGVFEQTLLTFVVYLNDDFTGGGTWFPDLGQMIHPKAGRALLFQHRVLHEAEEVQGGVKYVLRTDIFYREQSSG